MKIMQRQFIEMLSCSIRGEKFKFNEYEKINWYLIVEEAKEHDVKGLIYSSINNTEYESQINKELFERWKKDTFFSAMYQKRHINQVGNVLNEIKKSNIPVIVLKGPVIRDLYPSPDLRTMGDVDILVKEEDLEKIKEILTSIGYKEGHSIGHHVSFEHEIYAEIEVHWTLRKEKYFEDISFFEDYIWGNAIPIKVDEGGALSLNQDDTLLYLLMHLASHAAGPGFGVRQLCDIVLLVEKQGDLINWNKLLIRADKCGIRKFSMVIFTVCNNLFDMEIPYELSNEIIKSDNINLVIKDIFASGVHGKRKVENCIGNTIAYKSSENDKKEISELERRIKIVFPSIDNLPKGKYGYAKKMPLLLPIAWIHRIIYIFSSFEDGNSIKNRVNLSMGAINVSDKRSKLIKWLEL